LSGKLGLGNLLDEDGDETWRVDDLGVELVVVEVATRVGEAALVIEVGLVVEVDVIAAGESGSRLAAGAYWDGEADYEQLYLN
jgi:hypothetical protein